MLQNQTDKSTHLLLKPLLTMTRCKAFWEIPILGSISWQETSGDVKEITDKI